MKYFPGIIKEDVLRRPIMCSDWLQTDCVFVEKKQLCNYIATKFKVFKSSIFY